MARRDEVLAAALDLLDEVGLEALTTRRLAAKLGIQAGSLYRHYPSKRALLDAMAGDVLREVAEHRPLAGGTWDEAARRVATALRGAMLSRRDGARLLTTFQTVPEVGEQVFQGLADLLVEAGTPRDTALLSVDTLFGYVNGFTTEEQARTQIGGPDADAWFQAGVEIVLDGIRLRVP